jgi:hypothetical protein
MRAAMWYPAILSLAACSVNAQQKPGALVATIDSAVSQSRPAAIKALETLRKLADGDNYSSMGFESAGEAGQAELGEPLVLFYVRLDELRKFRPEVAPISLLKGGAKVQYPVVVGGQVRSSITLDNNGRGWDAVSYGGGKAARAVQTVRSGLAKSGDQLKPPYFLVDVLALGLSFIGALQGDKLLLVPVHEDRQARWKPGTPLAADRVFTELVRDAEAYNELPR